MQRKKIIALILSCAFILSTAITASAANISYNTKIQNSGFTAVGVTSCPGAYSVTASLTAYGVGGNKTAYAGNTTSTQAVATTSHTAGFYRAATTHSVDIYEGGLPQHYTRYSSASR